MVLGDSGAVDRKSMPEHLAADIFSTVAGMFYGWMAGYD